MELPEDHHHAPGGPRHESVLTRVDPGHRVRSGDSGRLEIHSPEGSVEIHEAALSAAASAQLTAEPGWVAWACWSVPDGERITEYRGTFTVPPEPAENTGQVVFLFLGLQKGADDGSQLLQPVLQWGRSAAGGGPYWSLSSWYVADGRFTFSDARRVEPGDLVEVSTARRVEHGVAVWQARAEVAERGVVASIQTLDDVELGWCCSALEAYFQQTTCGQYPAGGGTRFGSLSVCCGNGAVTPAWETKTKVRDCGQQVQVVSAQEVEIRYGSP